MKVTGKYYLFNRAIGYYSFSFMFLVLHVGVIYFESQLLGEGEKYASFYINDMGSVKEHWAREAVAAVTRMTVSRPKHFTGLSKFLTV